MTFPPGFKRKKSKVAQKKKGGASHQRHQEEIASAADLTEAANLGDAAAGNHADADG